MEQLGWTSMLLTDLCKVITDGSHYSPKESPEGTRLIGTVKDMTEFGFELTDCKKITEEDYHKIVKNGCKPEKGDVLFSKDGTMGLVQYFKGDVDIVLLSSIAILKPDLQRVDGNFLAYALKNPLTNKYIRDNFRSGSALPRIVLKDIKKLVLNVPINLSEQAQIASIFTSIDEKIELNLKMNKTLEAIAQAIFKEWFVDFRFPGFEGELIDGLPKGWKRTELRELINVKNGYAFKGNDFIEEGIPVIKIKNVKPNKIILNDLSYVSREIADKAKRYRINQDDILITMSGNRFDGTPDTWVGKVAIFMRSGEFLLNQRVSILDLKEPFRHYKFYLNQLLSSDSFQLYFIKNATSSGGQANISPGLIYSTEIVVPNAQIISLYNKTIGSLYAKTNLNDKEREILTLMRDILLPKIMTGKIRVA